MNFYNLQASYLFLVLIGLFFLFLSSQKRKKRALEVFAQKELLPDLMSSVDPRRQRQKAFFLLMALASGILALMRPQIGFNWEEGKRNGLDILVAIDVSKSMLVNDVGPNRLECAKQMVKDLLKQLKGDRTGLIAFSGEAFLVCPLTTDYDTLGEFLDSLDPAIIPKGGTAIFSALREARKSYKRGQGEKVLLLLSDGEDHEGDLIPETRSAQKEGIKIYSIGIGTKEGGLIPNGDQDHQRDFLKDDQGNVIKSSLHEEILEKIASMSGGTYVRGSKGPSVLKWIYDEKLSKLEKGEFEGNMRKRNREWFQIPLAMALLFLLSGLLIGERKKSVTREVR